MTEQNQTIKKDEIKKALSESQDMVGEKSQSEGIFHKIFRGYLPLNLLSKLKLEPEGNKKVKIDAYCHLMQIALRKNSASLDYLIKGYGTNQDEIKFKQTALNEYNEEIKKIEKTETDVRNKLLNPYPALKNWLDELKINRDNLLSSIVNPFQIDQDAYVPPEVLVRMKDIGLFKLKVPAKYGGLGFSQNIQRIFTVKSSFKIKT